MDEGCPTLTFNTAAIGRRAGTSPPGWPLSSPLDAQSHVGDLISHLHGEGRFTAPGGAGAANRERPDRHPVRGRLRRDFHGITLTAPWRPSRASSPPTAGCSARWATRAPGLCRRQHPGRQAQPSSRAARPTSVDANPRRAAPGFSLPKMSFVRLLDFEPLKRLKSFAPTREPDGSFTLPSLRTL